VAVELFSMARLIEHFCALLSTTKFFSIFASSTELQAKRPTGSRRIGFLRFTPPIRRRNSWGVLTSACFPSLFDTQENSQKLPSALL